MEGERSVGCALFAACPAQRNFELVYVGIAPKLRGQGLGRFLVEMGLHECAGIQPAWTVTCAVDTRNTPATALYAQLGFRAFNTRRAMVMPVRDDSVSPPV